MALEDDRVISSFDRWRVVVIESELGKVFGRHQCTVHGGERQYVVVERNPAPRALLVDPALQVVAREPLARPAAALVRPQALHVDPHGGTAHAVVVERERPLLRWRRRQCARLEHHLPE